MFNKVMDACIMVIAVAVTVAIVTVVAGLLMEVFL